MCTCPEEGCVKTFLRFSFLQRHLDGGRQKYALEKYFLLDKAMLRYAENLESGASTVKQQVEDSAKLLKDVSLGKQGWALKRGSSRGHLLNENQKKYLINLFLLGEQTERKTDPNKVAKSIRKVHNADGSLKVFFWAYILNKKHRTRRLLNIFTSCL